MTKRVVLVVTILCALVFAAGNTDVKVITKSDAKTITQKINYQGYLTNNSGAPITNPALLITFKIYDDELAGSVLWEATKDVAVENGVFNTLLDVTSNVFTPGAPRWLELTIGGVALTPRTELTAVGYSYKTINADTANFALNCLSSYWLANGNDIYYNAGNVGLGTSTPTKKLDVRGNIFVSDTLIVRNISNNHPVIINTPTTTLCLDTIQGFVGIGTTNPQYDLHIKCNHYANLMCENTTTYLINTIANKAGNVTSSYHVLPQEYPSNGRYQSSSTVIETQGSNGLSLATVDQAPIKLYTNGDNQRMIITGSGKVGIGTANPASPLEVNGMIHSTSGGYKFPDGTVQATASVGGGGTVTSVGTGDGLTGGPITTSGTISIADNGVTSAKIADSTITGADINSNSILNVNSLKGKILTGDSPYEFIWKDAGRTRISDTSDIFLSAQANLNGTGTRSKLMYLGDRSRPGHVFTIAQFGLGDLFVIRDSGNIGINTTTPTKKLEVAGSVKVRDTLFASNVSSNSPLRLQTAGTTRMYIDDATGRIGIGTTTPSEWLTLGTSGGSERPTIFVHGDVDRNFTGSSPDKPAFATMCVGGTHMGIGQVWGGLGLIAYDVDTWGAGNIQLFTGSNRHGYPSAERMRIKYNGNVGIGTTNPNSPLEVNGMIHSTSNGYKFPDGSVQTTAYTGKELQELIKQNEQLRTELEQLKKEVENLKSQRNTDNK